MEKAGVSLPFPFSYIRKKIIFEAQRGAIEINVICDMIICMFKFALWFLL